jgi:sec-independent protein translocase protein TatA
MSNFGPTELMIVLVIVVLLFGASKLPKLARSLGEAKNEFEKSANSDPKKDAAKELSATDGDEKVTMSKAELEALLAERELRAKRE